MSNQELSTAESSVLGSMLVERDALDKASNLLVPEHFTLNHNRLLFKKIVDLGRIGPVDHVILAGSLNGEAHQLNSVGGQQYIFDLVNGTPSALNVESYAGILIKARRERLVYEACQRAMNEPSDPIALQSLIAAVTSAGLENSKNLKAQSVADLLAEPERLVQWLIEGVWANGKGFIAGDPGRGKTWMALCMGIAVATGRPFLGQFPVRRKGPVLFVGEEESRANLKSKIELLCRGMGIKADEMRDFYHITQAFVRMPEDLEALKQKAKETGAVFIVFDAFRRFHGAEEKDSTELQPVLEAFSRLQVETGADIAIIHHLSKGGDATPKGAASGSIWKRLRGSGDLWAWRDCLIILDSTKDSDISNVHIQLRDAPEPAPFILEREFDEEKRSMILSHKDSENTEDLQTEIIENVKFWNGPDKPSRSDLYKKIGGRKATLLDAIKGLLAAEKLKEEKGGLYVPVF